MPRTAAPLAVLSGGINTAVEDVRSGAAVKAVLIHAA
jgi:hypothetical protein